MQFLRHLFLAGLLALSPHIADGETWQLQVPAVPFDDDSPTATIAYQPKWVKGLSVGLTRVVQQPEIILTVFNNWNLIFKNISRANDANELTKYLPNVSVIKISA